MNYHELKRFVRHLHDTGALSLPPESLEVAIREYSSEETIENLDQLSLDSPVA